MTSLEQKSDLLSRSLKAKKVLITSESLGPINGVTRATGYLLDYLLEQDIQTAAVAPRLPKLDTSRLTAPWQTRLPLVRLNGFPLVYNPDLMVVSPFRMSKIFQRTFQPDVIYLASPATLGLQTWWQLRDKDIPLVANFQTDLAFYARLMLPSLPGKMSGWLIDLLTGYFFRHPSIKAVLCPSTSSQSYLLGLGVSPEKLRLVGRGVDCRLFDPHKRNTELRQKLAPQGEVLLLCVSRLSLEKGFEFLAEAYDVITQKARQRNLSQKFRLVITGGNSNSHIAQTVRGYFEKRGLDVHFTGPLVGEPLAEMFATADVFVYPSLTETFGQVIQEAMASGLPVVARREGGPADLVLPDKTGYLSDPLDLETFADQTLKLIEDAGLRARLGHTARTLAETRSWDEINQQIAAILAEFAL
jgi:glycosyltransferase involved in cell wall biosynthesis